MLGGSEVRRDRGTAPRRKNGPISVGTIPVVMGVALVGGVLDTSERYIRKALQSGELPGGKIGREWRIDRDKLREKIGGK